MYRNIYFLISMMVVFEITQLHSQCTPPMAEECIVANVLCSLDEVNGYACNNPSSIRSPCSPLCSQGGVGHNTSWWGFVSTGGNVCITLTIGGCTTQQGLQFGIWGDCNCGEEIACKSIPCVPPGGVEVMCAKLVPCKTYYLWVDGCSGDVCDFTLNTSGGGQPSLKPLPFINNDSSKIIQPVCKGACNYLFFVDNQPGGCEPTYVWTFDGDEVGGNDHEVRLDFPDEGDFKICVTAYIGNPQSGSVCEQEGPQCATVKVRSIPEKKNILRPVCWEIFNGLKKDSFCEYFMDGTYRCEFIDKNCCHTIESGNFVVLDQPIPAEVYYITCDYEPYIDILGKAHNPCLDQFIINLPDLTQANHCDSSISLTAVYVEFVPHWNVQCIGGMVEISPNISIVKPCSVGETYQFDYRWYKKNDPAKKTISLDERLLVDAVSEDYCLEVNVRTELQTEFAVCAKTFCETYNETDLAPKCFSLAGDLFLCEGKNGSYFIDTFISQKVNLYTWTIDGGYIVTRPDTSAVQVKWLLAPGDTGNVCVFYDTDCGRSCEKCLQVIISINDAGRDIKKRGLSTNLNAVSGTHSRWINISGPSSVTILEPANPKTKIIASQYGIYCFEWGDIDSNCLSKDTVCVEFYKFKVADPEYPKRIFDERSGKSDDENNLSIEVLTPNIISPKGNSYFSFDRIIHTNIEISYTWIDLFGKPIIKNHIHAESGSQKFSMESPLESGFYILLFNMEDQIIIQKICVMN